MDSYEAVNQGDSSLLAISCGFHILRQGPRGESYRERKKPFSVTNIGLSIELLLLPVAIDTYMAKLDCVALNHSPMLPEPVCIFLRQLDQDGKYAREATDKSFTNEGVEGDYKGRMVRVNVSQSVPIGLERRCQSAT